MSAHEPVAMVPVAMVPGEEEIDDEDQRGDRLDYLAGRLSEIEDLRNDLRLAAEGLLLTRGILADIIGEIDVDGSEYADDLDRLDQIAHLLG
jgi:hypothetical protein